MMSVTIFVYKTMFGSSLPPIVCSMAYVLFKLCVCVWWSPTDINMLLFLGGCLSSSCVPNVASFSALSIVDCSFGIL